MMSTKGYKFPKDKYPNFGMRNKNHSPETREKLSIKGLNKKLSEEHRKKISLGCLKRKERDGFINSPEARRKMSISMIGKNAKENCSQETRKKQSTSHTGKKLSEETRKKQSISQTGKIHSKGSRKKASESHKNNWKNPEYRNRVLGAINSARPYSVPNDSEVRCSCVINEATNEGDYPYNKDEVICGKIPDFVNKRGQKKLIEFNGNGWHLEWARGFKTKEEAEEDRRKCFEPLGYKVLFIWGDELKDKAKLIEKIRKFDKEA